MEENKQFVHLHVHTQFSLLDGMGTISQIVSKVKQMGQPAVAITDHGVCFGLVKFFDECVAQGVKPILGCEFYEAPNSRYDKSGNSPCNHLVLLVKNEQGYKNLCKLVTRANTEGFYYKPRIDKELLEQFHEGLICLSGCVAGRIPKDILSGNIQQAEEDALWYKNLFGDDFYLEIQNHGLKEEAIVADGIIKLSDKLGIKMVCTNDCHYVNSEDAEAHDWLMCIQTKKTVNDPDRMKYEGDYSVKSTEEMRALFPAFSDAFDNTLEVAEKCNFEFHYAHGAQDYMMPEVYLPEKYNGDYFGYMADLCYEGFNKRYPEPLTMRAAAKERLEYELSTIKNMGFARYFLDVRMSIIDAHKNGVITGLGRGSGAGSIVNYCLEITDLEPLRYGLKFERFLNPDRVSMPDIDSDFCEMFREDVIRREAERYGYDKFCKIQTLGQLKAKSIIKDCARVAGYDAAVGAKLAKMIPNKDEDGKEVNLSKAYEMNPEIEEYLATDDSIRHLYKMATRLEGCKKSSSTHACGHVAVPVPCEELFPCRRDEETGYLVCQYDMAEIEHLGFLKKDLLMLKNLSVIYNACENIKRNHGVTVPLWTDEVINDAEALRLIGEGMTNGVFQLESEGMKRFMKELKPSCIEDVIAGVALYRPGPMDFIPKYIAGKKNPEAIIYPCEELRPILEPTYGCIVYQEQIMQISTDLAKFTPGHSDLLRKAMGKKKADVMAKEKPAFIDGCVANNIAKEIATSLWDDMEDFAKYAFNKSHAACYAVLAMETAYLKAHYPAEFMAALLTSFADNADKFIPYINECKETGLKVLAPCLNTSEAIFSADKEGNIVFGLSAIKGVGFDVISRIIDERNAFGEYAGISDLVNRVPTIAAGIVETLTMAGAMDCFGFTRNTILCNAKQLISGLKSAKKKNIEGQISIFDLCEEQSNKDAFAVVLPEMDKRILLNYEKETLGYYLSGHPLEEYASMAGKGFTLISAIKTSSTEDEVSDAVEVEEGTKVKLIVLLRDVTQRFTKKDNSPMATMTLEDMSDSIKAVCFPRQYSNNKQYIKEDAIAVVEGTVGLDFDGKSFQIVVDSIIAIDDAPKKVYIKTLDTADVNKVDDMISRADDGNDTVTLVVNDKMKVYPKKIAYNSVKSEMAQFCIYVRL